MKTIITITLILIPLLGISQILKIGDIITLNKNIPVDKPYLKYSDNQYPESSKKEYTKELEIKYKYKVLDIIEATGKIKIEAIPFKPTKKKAKEKYFKKFGKQKLDKADLYNYKIYTIDNDLTLYTIDYSETSKVPIASFGILTLPFKARPQDGMSYSTNFNLNSTINYNLINFYNSSISIQLGAGLSQINLNSNNSNGLIQSDTNRSINSTDVGALSFLFGGMYSSNDFQFGIYFGVDHINNQSYYDWKSNGNLWFGIGIGYGVFKIADKDKNNR